MAASDLVTIVLPGGGRYVVARRYQDQFQGLITDLNQGGYRVDPAHSHGYRPLALGETMTTNPHAGGLAIDINANRNPMGAGQPTDIPSDMARALAAKWGFQWGGDFRTTPRDPMHFQIPSGAAPALGMASLPTPPPPVPSGPMGGDQPLSAPAQGPSPVIAQAAAQQAPGPMLPPGMMPTMPGQPGSLAQAFMQAAAKARQDQQDQFGLG